MKLLFLGALLVHTNALAQGTRDLTRAEAATVFDRVLHGREHSALVYLDSLRAECAGHPLYHIMRARCMQEAIPMDDSNSKYAAQVAVPALGELDRAIEICTASIEAGAAGSMHYLYRGWAWMAKSYIRSMSRSFWTAGREAGRGKKDLKIYLGAYPDDTTANGLMGAFLYFADTVPKAFKFLSKLLRLPTGDREEGLDRLQHAAVNGGPLDTDYQLILYNVYFYFEGRYAEGLAGLRKMAERYPEYARTSIPLSVAGPFVPRLTAGLAAMTDSTVRRISGLAAHETDWNAFYIVQAHRAYGGRYCALSPAEEAYRKLIADMPQHPDWMQGFARFQLGSLYASLHRPGEAREILQSVVENPAHRYYREQASRMLKDLDKFADWFDRAGKPPPRDWIAAVYRSGPDSLATLAARFEKAASASLPATFYLAECYLLSGDYDRSLGIYHRIMDSDVPAWEEPYQMLAASRAAEVFGVRKEYKKAAEYYGRARDSYQKEYLIDWILDGRKWYFERLAEGKETILPTVLSVHP